VTLANDPDIAAREERLRRALKLGSLKPIPIVRACPVLTAPTEPDDLRPVAASGSTCPWCGTRGVYGCAHFQPSERVGGTR